jgi:hypothetical protein
VAHTAGFGGGGEDEDEDDDDKMMMMMSDHAGHHVWAPRVYKNAHKAQSADLIHPSCFLSPFLVPP